MLGAVDIGGTKIAVGLVTASGELVDSSILPTQPAQPYPDAIKDVISALDKLVQINQTSLTGIGIGATGRIHTDGTLQPNAFLPAWGGQNPAQDLSGHFDVTAAIENDADAAVLAEYQWGLCAGTKRLIYVTVSTGIGGGIIINKQLYRGVDGCHPEIGHHVIDPSGPACFCGAKGCWESLASGTAMAAWAHNIGGEPDWDARHICELVEQGNSTARVALAREARYLGLGLANLITIFAPDSIVLGGGLMQRWELFQENARIVIQSHCGLVPWDKIRLTVSNLQHPGLLGAAATWLYRFGEMHDLRHSE